ncbi:hypothetical protein BB561_004344 [Smittium simulii]|uniref:Retrotransposon gag domain-containing protein n=1 Tax=Smittium simulii TaxID=133385 RepID=A0A2T9YGV4_9FUNG|nr:hypothetical protein BB561_004344 [Smittium simulii]
MKFRNPDSHMDDDESIIITNKQFKELRFTFSNQKTTVARYIEKFINLTALIGTLAEDEALNRYLRGLKYAIKQNVQSHYPTDINTAAKLAETYDNTVSTQSQS